MTIPVLSRGPAGVRAQAMNAEGDLVGDFVFASGDEPGSTAVAQRVVHCRNAPSPGATSSLAIGRMMAGIASNSIFFLFHFWKKVTNLPGGKSLMIPRACQGKTFLFRSSQQLPCLWLGPLKAFLSWYGTLQGPSTHLLRCFSNRPHLRQIFLMVALTVCFDFSIPIFLTWDKKPPNVSSKPREKWGLFWNQWGTRI